ncbi:MAG: antibiotic biosynthesis monooxygenase [Chloroflexota bacterium]
MVLNVTKYNIHPDKVELFQAWVKKAIPRILALPGVVEFRAYRPLSGAWQVVTTVEFSDLNAWSKSASTEEYTRILDELHTLAVDVLVDVWGPSPVVPVPLKPGT